MKQSSLGLGCFAQKLLLTKGNSPSRKVNELDNRGTSFYLALYWAQAMAPHDEEFAALAEQPGRLEQILRREPPPPAEGGGGGGGGGRWVARFWLGGAWREGEGPGQHSVPEPTPPPRVLRAVRGRPLGVHTLQFEVAKTTTNARTNKQTSKPTNKHTNKQTN